MTVTQDKIKEAFSIPAPDGALVTELTINDSSLFYIPYGLTDRVYKMGWSDVRAYDRRGGIVVR